MAGNVVGVVKPGILDAGCWALVDRHIRSHAGGATNCGLKARPGFLTCRYHAGWESEARFFKQAMEERKAKNGIVET